MMTKIKKSFCNSLNKWQEKYFKGTKTELGKYFDISQGQISNVLAGRKCGDETWRRFVADKIGMNYDTMIGIPPKTGEDSKDNIVRFEDNFDKEHYAITKGFKNKQLAIEINQGLVDVEQLDSEELEEMKDIIYSKLKKLNKRHGKKNRKKKA